MVLSLLLKAFIMHVCVERAFFRRMLRAFNKGLRCPCNDMRVGI